MKGPGFSDGGLGARGRGQPPGGDGPRRGKELATPGPKGRERTSGSKPVGRALPRAPAICNATVTIRCTPARGAPRPSEPSPLLPAMMLRSWAHLTAPDLGGLAHSNAVVVLPLAAVEQHGPHLPLSTDLDLVLGVLAEAGRTRVNGGKETGCAVSGDELPGAGTGPSSGVRAGSGDGAGTGVAADPPASPEPGPPILILPPMAVGASLEHARYPGTLSLSGSLLTDVVVETGRGVAAAGFRRLVFLNGHGGNHASLQEAALRLRAEAGLLVVNLHYPRLGPPEAEPTPLLPREEWQHGLHAGAVETAMMLHLHPERVVLDRLPTDAGSGGEGGAPTAGLGLDLARAGSRIGPAGPVPFAWLAEDLSPHGVAGDPTLATAEIGARLLAHFGRGVAQVLRDTAAFPLERLAGRDASTP